LKFVHIEIKVFKKNNIDLYWYCTLTKRYILLLLWVHILIFYGLEICWKYFVHLCVFTYNNVEKIYLLKLLRDMKYWKEPTHKLNFLLTTLLERVFKIKTDNNHSKTVLSDCRSYQLVQKLLRSFKSIWSGWHRHLERLQTALYQCCQFVHFIW